MNAVERMNVCKGCEYNHENWCEMCGCWLLLKTRIPMAHCPLGLW